MRNKNILKDTEDINIMQPPSHAQVVITLKGQNAQTSKKWQRSWLALQAQSKTTDNAWISQQGATPVPMNWFLSERHVLDAATLIK